MIESILDSLAGRDLVEILDEVCRRRAVTRVEVCGAGRTKAVVRAHHELWWLLRHHAEACFSFEEIGRLFRRDHATVIHGVRAHAQRAAREHPVT